MFLQCLNEKIKKNITFKNIMFRNIFFYIITGCKQEILNLLEINMTPNYDFQKWYLSMTFKNVIQKMCVLVFAQCKICKWFLECNSVDVRFNLLLIHEFCTSKKKLGIKITSVTTKIKTHFNINQNFLKRSQKLKKQNSYHSFSVF